MDIDFVKSLSIYQATIPPDVFRIAAFFLAMQVILIIFRKKNDPSKDIWEDLAGVILNGLIVYMFPELIQFIEMLVNSVCSVDVGGGSAIQDYIKETNTPQPEESSTLENIGTWLLKMIYTPATGNSGSYALSTCLLKPLADIVNTICFPTYMIIRAGCLKVTYFVAPLVLMMGAIPSFESLWKQWFMVYTALLVSGPALIQANEFVEDCFNLYIQATGSPMLGFFIVAIARFKVFQAVMDLCYRFFRV